jgi:hypothetical protein
MEVHYLSVLQIPLPILIPPTALTHHLYYNLPSDPRSPAATATATITITITITTVTGPRWS